MAVGILAKAKYLFHWKKQNSVTDLAARASRRNDKGANQMLIIDRFEGNFAVIETSDGMVNVPISDIPPNSKEGDILILTIDSDTTKQREKRINGLMNDLFSD